MQGPVRTFHEIHPPLDILDNSRALGLKYFLLCIESYVAAWFGISVDCGRGISTSGEYGRSSSLDLLHTVFCFYRLNITFQLGMRQSVSKYLRFYFITYYISTAACCSAPTCAFFVPKFKLLLKTRGFFDFKHHDQDKGGTGKSSSGITQLHSWIHS